MSAFSLFERRGVAALAFAAPMSFVWAFEERQETACHGDGGESERVLVAPQEAGRVTVNIEP